MLGTFTHLLTDYKRQSPFTVLFRKGCKHYCETKAQLIPFVEPPPASMQTGVYTVSGQLAS